MLTGSIQQVPPAYSAKRVDGRRAYELARAGEVVELKAVTIRVDRWEVLAFHGADGTVLGEAAAPATEVLEARVRISCGAGTYVRSLARDLARLAKSAAHLRALRRVRSGPFLVDEALTVQDLTEGKARLQPALAALPGFPVQPLSEDELAKIVRGIEVPATVEGAWGSLTSPEQGVLVALAERRGDRWQPRVVMHEVENSAKVGGRRET